MPDKVVAGRGRVGIVQPAYATDAVRAARSARVRPLISPLSRLPGRVTFVRHRLFLWLSIRRSTRRRSVF